MRHGLGTLARMDLKLETDGNSPSGVVTPVLLCSGSIAILAMPRAPPSTGSLMCPGGANCWLYLRWYSKMDGGANCKSHRSLRREDQ